jgi:formylglycine-generating enzyme required for sulfatase activity
VSDFELDVFEVSVGRFRKFAEAFAAGYRPPEGAGKNVNNASDPGWNASFNALLPVDGDALVGPDGVRCVDEVWPEDFWTYTDEPGDGDSRPMNCLDWYLAYAFCIWDDARLPTEAEWNYAAAGGGEQRFFPWSDPPELDTIGETYASYYVDVTRQCGGDGTDGCAPTDLVAVGSKKDGYSRWHQADLGGNVWEWVQDLYAPYGDDCNDCANLDSGTNRVGRGGGYVSYWGLLRSESRVDFDPRYRSSAFGVRCARNVP